MKRLGPSAQFGLGMGVEDRGKGSEVGSKPATTVAHMDVSAPQNSDHSATAMRGRNGRQC